MARRQKQHGRADAAGVRDILSRRIGDALGALRGPRTLSDEAVHTARKMLKQARAGVRLLRGAAGAKMAQRENLALRDAARPLSLVRDAKVMLDVTQRLIENEKNAVARAGLARLQRALRSEQRQARAELSRGARGLKQVVRSLEAARTNTAQLRVKDDRPSALCGDMRRIYRKGRKAMRQGEAVRSDEKLHEARKHVKYLSAALKYFDEMGAADSKKLTECADSVADGLGDDHDLAVLQAKMAALSGGSGHMDAGLASRLKRRRARLQQKALEQARRLYKKKPAAFVASL